LTILKAIKEVVAHLHWWEIDDSGESFLFSFFTCLTKKINLI
jgi:hypothetical protein